MSGHTVNTGIGEIGTSALSDHYLIKMSMSVLACVCVSVFTVDTPFKAVNQHLLFVCVYLCLCV